MTIVVRSYDTLTGLVSRVAVRIMGCDRAQRLKIVT